MTISLGQLRELQAQLHRRRRDALEELAKIAGALCDASAEDLDKLRQAVEEQTMIVARGDGLAEGFDADLAKLACSPVVLAKIETLSPALAGALANRAAYHVSLGAAKSPASILLRRQ